jgi:hypothetical protein
MVEAIANSIEDKLVDGLSFKLNPGASYVVDRRAVTYHPQGSNIYSPNTGTKLIRIMLTGDNWLDPSTFRVMFNLKNDDTDPFKRLRPIGNPWAFFQRFRVLCGGQLVEDIMDYNRIHEMMHILIAKESRENDSAEAFGFLTDTHDWSQNQLNTDTLQGISPGDSMTVLFKPLSGILNQNKMLPLRYAPITLELELVSDETLPVISNYEPFGTGIEFTSDNTTTKWSINNVQVKCDVCTLDNALDNSYAQHLLSGKSLPISYNTFVSQMQTVSGPDIAVNVSRALTRLKSVFVTLQKDLTGQRGNFVARKSWNDFFSPMSAANANGILRHAPNGEFEFQLQIGSKLFPEYPVRSHAEAYYQLKKTLGVQASAVHNFDISAVEFRDHKFVLGTDCEKVLDAGFTGINTRAGDLMTVKFKNVSPGISTSLGTECLANRLHVVLHSDQIMEIRDTGVAVFD